MRGEIDSRTVKDEAVEGLSYRVDVEVDYDSRPDEYGLYPESAYTQKQVDAWKNDEWRYVAVVITPIVAGMELDTCGDSLWGVEYSLWGVEYGEFVLTDDSDNPQGVKTIGTDELIAEHPVPDMIAEIRGNLVTKLGGIVDTLRQLAEDLKNTEGS